jgi:CRP-like cAMP-binding protein
MQRKRALDVVQELQARPQLLAMIERWLAPPKPANTSRAVDQRDEIDPWLVRLATGQLASIEALLVELRRPALFSSVAGPALAALAEQCERRRVSGDLFRAGDSGDEMFVVVSGSLTAERGGESRTIGAGEVLGELAVLTQAPRAANVSGEADVLVIDRAAFAAASRRAPELVLGLASTLAGWLAPNRPDVL